MLKKIMSNIPLLLIVIVFIYSLTHLLTINQMTATSFQLTQKLFFSLYPLMVIFSILNKIGFFIPFGRLFSHLTFAFLHLNANESAIYLASIFSGYPTFAKLIMDAYKEGQITQSGAEHLLQICSHGSLGFVVTTLGTVLFQNLKIGWHLWLIHVTANLILAIITKKKPNANKQNISQKTAVFPIIKSQLKECLVVFIYIFGFILIFNILYTIFLNPWPLLHGWLEFSQGCLKLVSYSFETKFLFASIFISFSSFSVIFQVSSVLENSPISLKPYLISRVWHALISALLAMLYLWFK